MRLPSKLWHSVVNVPRNLRTLRPYVEWKLDFAPGDERYFCHFNEWYIKVGIKDTN